MGNLMRSIRRPGSKAQNFVEYTLILGVVGLALFSMQAYFKRGIQSVIKVTADDLGPQGSPFKDADKVIEQKKLEEATKSKYGYANKYTYTSTSSENVIVENRGEGQISRITVQGKASSDDVSY